MRLAFVETAAQASAVPSDCTIVALTPHAQVALEHSGRKFRRPQEYVAWDELERAGMATFETLERLCTVIDTIAAEHVAAVREYGLRPGRWHLFELKPIYDGVWLTALRLRRILAAEQPDEVVWFASGTEAAHILELLTLSVPLADPRPAPASTKPRSSHLRRVAARIRRRLEALRPTHGLRILLLDDAYNLPLVAAELRRLGHTPISYVPAAYAPRLEAGLWAALAADAVVREAFVQDDLDLWTAATPRLRPLLECGVARVVAEHAAARSWIAATRANVLFASMAAVAAQKAACHAAHEVGIPVVVVRHGELGTRHVPMVAYQDVEAVDWVLCWGRWEARWIELHARRAVQTEIVGAPMIEERVGRAPERDRIRAELGIPVDARVALYVPTALSGEEWYASSRIPDDSTYFAQQTAVVRALSKLGFHVVVKEHPFGRPTPLDGWAEPLAGVQLVYAPGFSDLVHLPDTIVLDAPSTTLVEALFGSAAVVVVDHPVFDWQPEVREHLQAHGVAFATAETLGQAIPPQAVAYGPEAREPLVSVTDEPAALRAARALIAIASQER